MIVDLETIIVAIIVALIGLVIVFLRSSWQDHKDEQMAKAVQMVMDHAFVLGGTLENFAQRECYCPVGKQLRISENHGVTFMVIIWSVRDGLVQL